MWCSRSPLEHNVHYKLVADGWNDHEVCPFWGVSWRGTIQFRLYSYDISNKVYKFCGGIWVPYAPPKIWNYYDNQFKDDSMDLALTFQNRTEQQLVNLVNKYVKNPQPNWRAKVDIEFFLMEHHNDLNKTTREKMAAMIYSQIKDWIRSNRRKD